MSNGSFAIMAAYKRYADLRIGVNVMLWGWLACMASAAFIFFGDLLGRMGILTINVNYPWFNAFVFTMVMFGLGLWGRAIWLVGIKRREEALSHYRRLCKTRDLLNPY